MKIRLVAFFTLVGCFSLAYQAGSQTDVSAEDAVMMVDAFEELVRDIDAFGIFLHNTTIAMTMFIPGFGLALSLFSAWSTGTIFSALATISPALADVQPLAVLYLTPFGLMELAAYSLAASRSALLTVPIIKRASIRPQLKHTGIEAGIVLGLLLAGGYIEFYMIQNSTGLDFPGS